MMDDKKKTAALDGEDIIAEREDAEREDAERDTEGNDLILRFRKPYLFEGREYTELDLTGLENTSAATLSSVGRAVAKKSPGLNAASVEMTLDYAKMLAQRIIEKPIEFFDRMPAKDAMTLKGIVVGFLFGGDGDN